MLPKEKNCPDHRDSFINDQINLSDPSESYGSSYLLVLGFCDLDRIVAAAVEDVIDRA